MSDMRFRPDLYVGTAADYDRFRPDYPAALVDDLLRRTALDRGARVLDLACGTGQVAFALRPHVRQVVAADQEADAVAFGRARARHDGVDGIEWLVGRAEDLAFRDAAFDLVAIGNAYHRLGRRQVAANAYGWLRLGGHVALLWSALPWDGEARWQRAMRELVSRWQARTGATDRIPAGFDEAMAAFPHTAVLADAGFELAGRFELVERRTLTVDGLAGVVASTSVLSRAALGRQAERFDAELRRTLLAADAAGSYVHDLSFAYDLARRPHLPMGED